MTIFGDIVKDVLSSKRARIDEYAIPRKRYITALSSRIGQILENWCLCKYCALYDLENNNYAHWLTELKAQIVDMSRTSIKGGNTTKTARNVFIDMFHLDEPTNIFNIVERKFKNEGISECEKLTIVCDICSKAIGNIIDILTNNISIKDYFNNEFNVEL